MKLNPGRNQPSHEKKYCCFHFVRNPYSTILHSSRLYCFGFVFFYIYLKSDCFKRKIIAWGVKKHLFQVCQSNDNKLIVK